MSVIEKNLMAGERLVYRGHLHRIIFLKAAGIVVVALAGFTFLPHEDAWLIFSGVILAAGVVAAISAAITWYTSEFILTNKRITMRVGLIHSHSVEILLTKVEAMTVDQDIFGRLLNYGTISIRGTGGTQERFDTIAAPFEFRKMTQEQIASAQEPTATR
jgi:uncharacterized membrane protein YdbT with pleckstrin-like domain